MWRDFHGQANCASTSVMQMVAPRKSPITPPSTDLPYAPAKYVETMVATSTRQAWCHDSTAHAIMAAVAVDTRTRGKPRRRFESPNLLARPSDDSRQMTRVAPPNTLHTINLQETDKAAADDSRTSRKGTLNPKPQGPVAKEHAYQL